MTNQTPNFRLENIGLQPISSASISNSYTFKQDTCLTTERSHDDGCSCDRYSPPPCGCADYCASQPNWGHDCFAEG